MNNQLSQTKFLKSSRARESLAIISIIFLSSLFGLYFGIQSVSANKFIDIRIAPNIASLAVGEKQTFVADIRNGSAPYTIRWYSNDTYIGCGPSIVFSFSEYCEYVTLKCAVTDSFGNYGLNAIIVYDPTFLTVIESGSMVSTASFIVFNDGSTYYSRNGLTGVISYSGTSANTVIQSTLSGLTAGRTWKEKVVLKGIFTITSRINLSTLNYTILDLTGARLIQSGADLITLSESDGTHPVHDVDIIGGWFIGDGTAHDAIWGKGGLDHIIVSGGRFSYFGTGATQAVYLRGCSITVENCLFEEINGVPVLIGRDEAETFNVENNKILYNTVLNSLYVDIEDSLAFDQCGNGKMIGNYVAGHGCLKLFGHCTNTEVSLNTVTGTKYGLHFQYDGNGALPSNTLIQSNHFLCSGVSGSQAVYLGGDPTPYRATRTKIYDNYIDNCAVVAINLWFSDLSEARRNTITNCATPIGTTGALSYTIKDNLGFITENSGSSTITATNSYVVVTHGLAGTPTNIQLTPSSDLGGRGYWWSTAGATTFRIYISSVDLTSSFSFSWEAEYKT